MKCCGDSIDVYAKLEKQVEISQKREGEQVG